MAPAVSPPPLPPPRRPFHLLHCVCWIHIIEWTPTAPPPPAAVTSLMHEPFDATLSSKSPPGPCPPPPLLLPEVRDDCGTGTGARPPLPPPLLVFGSVAAGVGFCEAEVGTGRVDTSLPCIFVEVEGTGVASVYIYTHIYTHTHTHIYTYIYIHTYIRTYIHIHIYTYTRTHTHIYPTYIHT